jgi:hypothetical protein
MGTLKEGGGALLRSTLNDFRKQMSITTASNYGH